MNYLWKRYDNLREPYRMLVAMGLIVPAIIVASISHGIPGALAYIYILVMILLRAYRIKLAQ